MRSPRWRTWLIVTGAASVAFGCSSLIGLSSLDRVSCLDDCAGNGVASTDAGADAGGSGGNAQTLGGALNDGGPTVTAGAGTVASDGGSAGELMNLAGAAGEPATKSVCPGGVAPALTWQEHWFEHDQLLKRVSYDDCSAVYFDNDMDPNASKWLSPFVSSAWAYSVKTYGYLGPERVYAVFHQGKYSGGHVALFNDASHDFHDVEDAAATDWTQNYSDLTLALLSFIVEGTGAHTKLGSPAFPLWQNGPWPQFYEYDIYVGLGLNDQAAAAFNKFNQSSFSYPRAGTFWFRDWFYPLWRDHGHAQVMANFYNLLEKYFPASNGTMGDMNWGEYVHFTSGAAHTNLKPLATAAFGWLPEWDQEFLQAETDYPDITY